RGESPLDPPPREILCGDRRGLGAAFCRRSRLRSAGETPGFHGPPELVAVPVPTLAPRSGAGDGRQWGAGLDAPVPESPGTPFPRPAGLLLGVASRARTEC